MQKLPVLKDDGEIIADSFFIQNHLMTKYAFDLDSGLDPNQRAHSHALVRMFEEHVYFIALVNRWVPDANWAGTKDVFFGNPPSDLVDKIQGLAPKFLRGFIANVVRKGTIKAARAHGIGRFDVVQLAQRLEPDISALKMQLGSQAFLFGDTPTLADTSIIPILDALVCNRLETPLTRLVSDDQILMGYIERGRAAFYVT
jgi:glutathione S-transferase